MSKSIKIRFYEVVSETLKSVVLDAKLPGNRPRETFRVPKKLCRNWTNETVDIYAPYFDHVTLVNKLTSRADEFDDLKTDDSSDVLKMPEKARNELKQ